MRNSGIRSFPAKHDTHVGVLSSLVRRGICLILMFSCLLLIACTPSQSVAHPRIWLTPEVLQSIKAKATQPTQDWVRFKKYIDGKNHYNAKYLARSYALAYQVTEKREYARKAAQTILEEIRERERADLNETPPLMVAAALVYDWCYPELTANQRRTLIDWINTNFQELENEYDSPWHNYAVSLTWAFGIAGYATQGDNQRAEAMIQNARQARYAQYIEPGLRFSGDGGAWAESSGYGANTTLRLVQYAEAVLTATGEDIFHGAPFYRDRLAFSLFHCYPGIQKEYSYSFRQPYIHGDGGRGLKGHQNYLRSSLMMLVRRFPEEPMAEYAQDWLNQAPANKMPHDWAAVDDVMWYNPQGPSRSRFSARMPLSHYVEGAGAAYMRSDWTNDATWLSFQCGDHFEYHQHLDQNSFTFWKYEDLAVESGVYTWANSDHANNYYIRTIAHNSMLVFNPDEKYSWDDMRGGYKGVNDGGQRAWKLSDDADYVSWSAESIDHWQQNRDAYDTGDIKRYEDRRDYAYILGDATNAYRRDKVENFTRQLVFLRPDIVVIFDRIASTQPEFTKTWLLHFLGEPQGNGGQQRLAEGEYELTGDQITCKGERGQLVAQPLLPVQRRIVKIGGDGVKDCWVNGEQFDPGKESYGFWRIEISPTVPSRSDLFLNVLTATEVSTRSVNGAQRIEGDTVVGALIDRQAVLFGREEQDIRQTAWKVQKSGQVWFLLCDVEPEMLYQVSLGTQPQQTVLSSAQHTLSFGLTLKGQHEITVRVMQ